VTIYLALAEHPLLPLSILSVDSAYFYFLYPISMSHYHYHCPKLAPLALYYATFPEQGLALLTAIASSYVHANGSFMPHHCDYNSAIIRVGNYVRWHLSYKKFLQSNVSFLCIGMYISIIPSSNESMLFNYVTLAAENEHCYQSMHGFCILVELLV